MTFSRKAGEQVQLGSLPFASLLGHLVPPRPPHEGISLPITPKTMIPLSFPSQVGDAGFRKTGAVDSGRIFGGDHRGLGVTTGRGSAHTFCFHRRVAALDSQVGSSPGGA